MPNPAKVIWQEDGSADVYGRLTARDGTGASVLGEGRFLKQADIASISYRVIDDEGTETGTGDVVIEDCIFDTPQTTALDQVWRYSKGYNFRHVLGPTNFPEGDKVYTAEYRITTTGGTIGWAVYEGRATPVRTS